MARADYGLIVGQGRSGTNWLLQLFDQSPETFCRNEPYGSRESPLHEIAEDRFWVRPDQSVLDTRWDDIVGRLSVHMGIHDHEIAIPKQYLNETSRRLGLYHVLQAPRIRQKLGAFLPSFRAEEWAVPRLIGDPQKLADAAVVLKLVTPPGWTVFVLRKRPTVPVYHIVRHPGGFLNSWWNRWAKGRDMQRILADNRARLRNVVAADPSWADRFGDIDAMSVERAELSYWIYMNTVVFDAGQGTESYHHIVYEQLVADPVGVMKHCYAAMGLVWNSTIEARIAAEARDSSSIASAWREKLSPERLDLVEEFLALRPGFYPPAARD